MYKVFIIPISNPILVGVYDQNNNLVEVFQKDGKTSDILPNIFKTILEKYSLSSIFYVNGPGSYMSIKVSYIFLKTISIVHNIKLKASSGFNFNNNSPIKALGKKYFFNTKDDTIIVDFLDKDKQLKEFLLPDKIDETIFSEDSLPNYNLPAIN
ncbi:MAG: hypothetical protein U9O56_00265 [Campylobacterota bacterium]|nr:hypothetical protein [Campylobacterota bacterium]